MLERDLAEQLGLKRAVLSKIRERELIENRHYVRTASGILLKGDGLDAMLQALDLWLDHQVENAAPAIPETAAAALPETAATALPETAAAAEASSPRPSNRGADASAEKISAPRRGRVGGAALFHQEPPSGDGKSRRGGPTCSGCGCAPIKISARG